jgi:hypothetical protein
MNGNCRQKYERSEQIVDVDRQLTLSILRNPLSTTEQQRQRQGRASIKSIIIVKLN